VQTVRLSAGEAGNRVEFGESIDWKTLSANLKAVIPLSAANQNATYNWEIGTIERPTEQERQFEVASHHWIDLTDQGGAYGTTILTDVKNGSDKRDDHTIRLTLIRTPGPAVKMKGDFTDQMNQDWGRHEILFGVAGHNGGWRDGQTDWQAYRLSVPLIAFETARHAGALGKSFSLVTVNDPDVRILALKKAEMSDETIVRLVELHGQSADNLQIKFAGPIEAAREVNGQEQELGSATLTGGALETSFKPYQPRSFALRLGAAPAPLNQVKSEPVSLKYDLAAASDDDTKSASGFDKQGDALPAEMLPSELNLNGVGFKLAPAATGVANALVAKSQAIELPAGDFNRVYVLAASAGGDQQAVFHAGSNAEKVTVQDWRGFIGQWDTRVWRPRPETVKEGGERGQPVREVPLRKDWAVSANHATWDLANTGSPDWSPRYPEDYLGMKAGFVKPATLAWYCSHHHTAAGLNEPYQYSYLFAFGIDLPAGARTLTLPANENIRVLAVSVAKEDPQVKPVQALFDTLGRTQPGTMVAANSKPN
jgi:alpha-mannosidase